MSSRAAWFLKRDFRFHPRPYALEQEADEEDWAVIKVAHRKELATQYFTRPLQHDLATGMS
jgi:hypothetical protein